MSRIKKIKHDWHHLIPHNDLEGPFPTFCCRKCGKFASGASNLDGYDSFSVDCIKLEVVE